VQFMALIYGDEAQWDALSDEERKHLYERYTALGNDASEAGVLAGGEELDSTRSATTVRVRDGQTLVTDGPYAETKEQLGGYYLFDCPTWDEALDWAARIPAVEHGAIEVRQVHVDEEEEAAS
jgi:hypothetical protein